jgi:glutamine amidotransferase
MIAVIDYGMGNLLSVKKAFEKIGAEAVIVHDEKGVKKADKIVLPGVGAFGDCIENLDRLELIGPIKDFIHSGKPYLGICLGLQILFSESEEFGSKKGLDLIPGKVLRFSSDMKLKIPHIGWNSVHIKRKAPVLEEIVEGTYFYFVHSYHVVPEGDAVVSTTTEYGINFVSGLWKENIYAFQFHPEKSQAAGLRILKAFDGM